MIHNLYIILNSSLYKFITSKSSQLKISVCIFATQVTEGIVRQGTEGRGTSVTLMFLIKLLGYMGHRQVSRLHGTKVDMYLDYIGQRQISAANNFSNSPRNSSTSVFSLE